MTRATYELAVDWDGDGVFGGDEFFYFPWQIAAAETDLIDLATPDLIAVECRRGRDYASQLTGRATAGQLRATLRNVDGKYSSFNASSPLYGLAVPGRKVRLRTVDPIIQTLWTGYLDRIVPAGTVGGIPTATLEASGPLSRLTGKQVSPAKQTSVATGTIIGAILDAAGWPAGARNIDTGQTTISAWHTDRTEALTAIREIEETELGFVNEAGNGDLNYEDRHHRLKSPHTASVATFSDAAGATNAYRSIEQQDPLREIYNEIIATVSPLQAAGSVSVLWTLDEQPTIGVGAELVLWAEYPNAEVDPQVGAYVDAWTTPVGTTDVTVTGVAIGDIGIAVTKFANTMQIALTNNGAATTTVTLLQARGDPVRRKAAVRVTTEDATSQAAYGARTYRLPGPWLPNTNPARDFVQYLLSRYKDPLPALRMEILANRDSNAMSQALERDISDRVTVVATGAQTKLGIDGVDFFIEAIQHRITNAGTRHEVFFDLSESDGDAGYWTLGVSALGVDTKLAY